MQHLQTKYVFVDTEVFRKAAFDWTGRLLSRFVELAKQDQLRLLITDITRREVKSQLRELLNNAATAIKKHEVILRQLGASEASAVVEDRDEAAVKLDVAFQNFLNDVLAIEVPLVADLHAILDDYFDRRAPFSNKKKSEFPDAIAIASLLAWCTANRAKAYVVSGDPDLKACCSASGPLFHVETLAEVISQAVVSEDLHNSIVMALAQNEGLKEELADQIKSMSVDSGHGRYPVGVAEVSGRIEKVTDISIHHVNVIDHTDQTFTCEIEYEAELELEVAVLTTGGHGGVLSDPSRTYTVHELGRFVFSAEVVAIFDPKNPQDVEIKSVHVYGETVDLSDRRGLP